MKYQDLYQKLSRQRFYVFSFADLRGFFRKESPITLRVQLSTWKKKGWLKPLKRGVYKLAYPEEKEVPDLYVANYLYKPSYVSLETALSLYSIIPEVAAGVTSVTPKPTRKFGGFTYHSIQPRAYRGYRIIKQQGFEIRVAEPEKALVDYLYFKLRTKEEISERFEREALKKLNRKKLDFYADLFSGKIKKEIKRIYACL